MRIRYEKIESMRDLVYWIKRIEDGWSDALWHSIVTDNIGDLLVVSADNPTYSKRKLTTGHYMGIAPMSQDIAEELKEVFPRTWQSDDELYLKFVESLSI